MKRGTDTRQPVYMISVVSRMLRVHPQTLRLYEREGFVTPHRTKRARLYSQADVDRLSVILSLTRELGVNRAGVDIIMRLKYRLEQLQREVDEMMGHLEKSQREDFEQRLKKLFFEE